MMATKLDICKILFQMLQVRKLKGHQKILKNPENHVIKVV